MHNHHKNGRMNLRDITALITANLVAGTTLIAGALHVPELLMLMAP